jgi:peptidyl-prolyl cis-trans isomerase SurA
LQAKVFFRSGLRFTAVVLGCGFLLAAVNGCHRSPSPNVVATVNSKEIQRADLEKYYKMSLGDNPQEPSAEQADIVRLNVLQKMIEEEILQQRAAKLNLAASDEDVNAKLTEMKAPYTQEEFDKQLKARNITLDDLKRDLRSKLTSTKLLNKEIESKINITDAEIGGYYAAHKSDFNLVEPQYRLAQIGVTSGTAPQQADSAQTAKPGDDAEARKTIQAVHSQLEGGADFSNLAVSTSQLNTASNGGDMGFVPESQLHTDAELFSAISKLKPGQITDVLPIYMSAGPGRRPAGYAIYKLIEREPAGQRELNDPRVQQNIRQSLREGHAQLLRSAYFEMLHNEAKIHNYFADQILKQGAQ